MDLTPFFQNVERIATALETIARNTQKPLITNVSNVTPFDVDELLGNQTIERLETGELTFPRPDAKHLLRIKRGELDYKRVEEKLEMLIDRIREVHATSDLPETIDEELARQITLNFYSNAVFQTDPRKLGWAPASEDSLLGEAAFKMAAAS